MTTTDPPTDEQRLEPNEPMTSRRELMAAGTALSVPLFWGTDDLGFFETHWVADDGEKLKIDPEVLNFADGIDVEETDEGVDISVPTGGSGASKLTDLENVNVSGWLEGTFADRPATGDVPAGVRYWATDRNTAYRNTSNGWDVNGGTGTAENPIPEQHVGSVSTEQLDNVRFATQFVQSGAGTHNNPWILDPNDPVLDIPDGEFGSVFYPAGNYEWTTTLDMSNAVRQRTDLVGAATRWTCLPIMGASRMSTNIVLADGVDDHMVLYTDEGTDIPAEDNLILNYFGRMTLIGNKENNAAGSGIAIKNTIADEFIHGYFEWLWIRENADHCFEAYQDEGQVREMQFVNFVTNRSDDNLMHVGSGNNRWRFVNCKWSVSFNDVVGIDMHSIHWAFVNCEWRGNGDTGLLLRGDKNVLSGCRFHENSRDQTSGRQIGVLGNENETHAAVHASDKSDSAPILDQNNNDNRYSVTVTGYSGNPIEVSGSTRVWFNGQYFPESLAGTTGDYVGDTRMDDGTNVSTSGPMECTWTGSAWQPADGGATFS